tara:strand:- start:62864 stop:64780 length:1917 start_codon:yes stop_codon:yes gene_type:complete
MNFYITKLFSAIPAAQKSVMSNMLARASQKGKLRTRGDVADKLDEMGLRLQEGTAPKPLIESYSGLSHSSIGLDRLMEYCMMDSTIIYEELDNISEIFEAIDRLNTIDFKAIEKGLAELDTRITLSQILDQEIFAQNFKYGILDTFDSSDSFSLSTQHPLASSLYKDPVTNDLMVAKDVMQPVQSVEGLVLPSESTKIFPIGSAYVSQGFNTTESDYNLTPGKEEASSGFIPSSTVDSIRHDDNSIWTHFVYIERGRIYDSPPENIKAELILDMGGIVTTNTIKMLNSSPSTVTIDNILYESPDGNIYSLIAGPIVINSTEGYSGHFATVSASRFYIQMSQSIYITLNSEFAKLSGAYIDLPPELSSLADSVDKIAITEISGIGSSESIELNGWLYNFAFNKIELSYSSFLERGVYISKPLKVDGDATHVCIDALIAKSENDSGNPGDNVEYWVHKFDYSHEDILLKHVTLPILPMRTNSVEHRALLLNQNGIGKLPFILDGEITIYRDFTPLVIGVDYELSIDNAASWQDNNPPIGTHAGPPYGTSISIKHLDPSSTYTVSCDVKLAKLNDSILMYMDENATAVLGGDAIYSFREPSGYRDQVKESVFFLVIIARSLNHNKFYRSSPLVFHYGLYAG